MQRGVLDWILEQKKGICGKTNKIQAKCGVLFMVAPRHWLLGFDRHVLAMWGVSLTGDGPGANGISVIFAPFL